MSMREIDQELVANASRLKLTFIRGHMRELLENAASASMTPRETLKYFFEQEVKQRDANRFRLWLMAAHFPVIKELSTFDAAFQPSLDPGVSRELCTLDWVSAGENVVLMGPRESEKRTSPSALTLKRSEKACLSAFIQLPI